MNTYTGSASVIYPDYLQAYTQAKGSTKGALKYATFARHLQNGKAVKVADYKFYGWVKNRLNYKK